MVLFGMVGACAAFSSERGIINLRGNGSLCCTIRDKCEELNFLQIPLEWLILNGTSTAYQLNKQTLHDTNFAVTVPQSDSQEEIELRSIYKIDENSTSFSENYLGTYSTTNNSIRDYRPLVIGIDRIDLMGAKIRAAVVFPNEESRVFNIETFRREDIYMVYKMYYLIIETLLPSVNASPTYRIHRSWDYVEDNVTRLNGLFVDFQNGLSDIAGTSAYVRADRVEYTDFVGVAAPFSLKFVLRKPPLSNIKNLFILPFALTVWYAICALLAVTIVCYFCLISIDNTIVRKKTAAEKKDSRFFDAVLVQVGAITQQGTETEPKSGSGRIAFFVIFLALMFFYTAYSANIVVLLQSKSDSIRTTQDLLDSRIEIGVEDLPYVRYYFETVSDPVQKAFYTRKIAPNGQKPHYYHYVEGIPKVRDEFFAFFFEGSMGYKVIQRTFLEHQICGLTEVEFFNFFKPSLSVRKRSPYRRILRIAFRKLVESGVLDKFKNQFIYKKPPCLGNNNNFISVGIDETYFAFVVFLVGSACALLLLIVEVFLQKLVLRWMRRK